MSDKKIGLNTTIKLVSASRGIPHAISNKFNDEIKFKEIVYTSPRDVDKLIKNINERFPDEYFDPVQIEDSYFRFSIKDSFGNIYHIVIRCKEGE